VEFSKMQGTLENVDEMTYAGQAVAQDPSYNSNSNFSAERMQPQHPLDRNTQIYDYVTLVAELCHDARVTRVNEVNSPEVVKA
jgi:hypothetical protein